jgi:hypothetical protein
MYMNSQLSSSDNINKTDTYGRMLMYERMNRLFSLVNYLEKRLMKIEFLYFYH